ncbi:P-loop NTPase fold protein [uncultured Bacteroides sp.]|uniref:P-loop NTPase fold protein n=1 Tax=uncultured Bacteroides sp. TaxID=162156 RepID=UPI00280B58AD|nr:P-loop NTPase fold protein [uncultured Bacteroides sp.]
MINSIKGHILSNAPCNDDLFEGNAHKTLAITIAHEIETDEKCTIIGIDGGWGSGKSNLVGLVNKELAKKKDKYHSFTYDAWGHQNDLPRRTLLEELISDLVEGSFPIFNEESWKISLDELLAKKKITNTKTVPALGAGIIVSGLLLMFTPLFYWLSTCFYVSWAKILCMIAPYILAYGITYWRHYYKMKSTYDQKDLTCEKIFTEFFLLYKDEINENTKYETISEREPSSRQFKNWMDKVDAGLKANNKVLILVIDNMDRLPKAKVQELWATIHSIFCDANFQNIKIIIPFDRAHIKNAFQSEDIVRELMKNDMQEEKSKDVVCYGNDFINKTFYVVYRVSPPILTGWKNYFEKQWKNAFGEEYPLDSAVTQIYDLMNKEHTPRKIIAFINEFVSTRQIADGQIEDKYIALFILGRESIVANPLNEIVSPSYLGSLEFLYKDDDMMSKSISALYFQLCLEDAMDVVFTRRFTYELDNNEVDTLRTIKENSKYWGILQHSIANVVNVENATLALDAVFGNDDEIELQKIWDVLYRMTRTKKIEIKMYQKYQKILLSHILDKQDYFNYLINVFHKLIDDDFDVKAYITCIDELASVEGYNSYEYLADISTQIKPMDFVMLVMEKKERYCEYGLCVREDELDEYLMELEIAKLENLTVIPVIKEDFKLAKYTDRIVQLVKENATDVIREKYLIKRLKEVVSRPINIQNYLNDSQIQNLARNSEENNEFFVELCAMRLSRWNEFAPSPNYNTFNSILSSEDVVLQKKISELIEYYSSFGDILINLKSFTPNTLIKEVARNITLNSYGVSTMNIAKTLKDYESILAYSEITAEQLLNRLNDWAKYINTIDNSNIMTLPIQFFKDAQIVNNQITTHCLSIAANFLQSITQEQWKISLGKEDYNFQLLQVYHPLQIQNCFDALKELLRGYASGDIKSPLDQQVVNKVIKISNEVGRDLKPFFRGIRDLFISQNSITREKLRYFGMWLFHFANMQNKSDALEKILPTDQLDDPEVIKIIIQNAPIVKAMVEKSNDSSEFMKKIEALLKGAYKENNDFKELCNVLGINIEVSEENEL